MPRLRLVSSPLVKNEGFTLTNSSEENATVESKPQLRSEASYASGQQENVDEQPKFVKHEESTNIELFYDLFFVANLTTFSNVHEVNSKKTLTSYMGFFCILWFTWCQTSLFDLRFVADSWLERAFKACHLAVMTGLAVVGPRYDTVVGDGTDVSALQTMSLILAVSRFVIGLQYLHIGFQVRNYRNTKLPLGLLAGAMELAALIYFIVSFVFKKHEHAYRAFYVIAVLEMIVNIGLSSMWKVLGFKRTHLVERMGLLTLYILGEGVIDVLKSIGQIVQVDSDWTSATIGLIVAGIAGIYMLYMLYFDCLNHKHFGSIRQQIWAFAHFPFHVALVLSMSGMAQFAKWFKVVEVCTPFVNELWEQIGEALPQLVEVNTTEDLNNLPQLSNETFYSLGQTLNNTINDIFEKYKPEAVTADEVSWGIYNITSGYSSDLESRISFLDSAAELMTTVLHSVFTTYGFEGADSSESDESATKDSITEVNADFAVIGTVFLYFFVAAGLTLILLGFLSLIMDTHRRWGFGTIIRFVSHLVVGLTVALLAIMRNYMVGTDYSESAWVLPTYTFAVALVLGFHHIKWGARDKEVDEIDYMIERADGQRNMSHSK